MKKVKLLMPALLLIIAALCFSACDTGPKEWTSFPSALRGTWTTTYEYAGTKEYVITAKEITVQRRIDGKIAKYQLAYGEGPIKGPNGDDYEFTVFILTDYDGYTYKGNVSTPFGSLTIEKNVGIVVYSGTTKYTYTKSK